MCLLANLREVEQFLENEGVPSVIEKTFSDGLQISGSKCSKCCASDYSVFYLLTLQGASIALVKMTLAILAAHTLA